MDLLKQKQWFDSQEFEAQFHCELPLGAFCTPGCTVFRLWAPTAEAVTLRLYQEGSGSEAVQTIPMTPAGRGLWTHEAGRTLDGMYYDYCVTVDGAARSTADPYARACGLNGSRSMVLDLRRTDPVGWQQDQAPSPTPEQVIYELHVKDFSWDLSGGFDPSDRGKYTALTRTGTTLNCDGVHPTGLDYLKRLGVTHIQLMPVYDYGSVDEASSADCYNWGYDPVNYNIPEGSYSSDPHHGEVRIRELKEAIGALHRNGFRVIMDVVYNHTFVQDSWLWRTVPWYYYRQHDNGAASNGSGCGNDIASERSMCAKYILDSVLYWTEEYHMDGFRFDLMGLLDAELMNRIQAELDRRYGAGEKLVYGEPWSADATAVRPGTVLCHKGSLKALTPSLGAFCDDTRDAVKGGLMDVHSKGFVNGGGIRADRLRPCIAGWAERDHDPAQAPSQVITYLSCHDDWTLWDKLVCTMDEAQQFDALTPDVLRANRLAAAISFCCQGRPFFLAGEEFARTKGGVKNSYCSEAQVNRLDWNRAWEANTLVDWYRGLIALRQQLPGLQDKSALASRRILAAWDMAPNCAAIRLNNSGSSHWQELLMIFHAGVQPQPVQLPEGNWQVLADAESTFRWQESRCISGKITLPPVSPIILGK